MNRKQKVQAALMGAAFLVVLFIVGAIEHGAAFGLILLTIPALIVMAMGAKSLQYVNKK